MNAKGIGSYLLILAMMSCVDRFYNDIAKLPPVGVSVAGYISDEPGPYEVRLYSSFDIESRESMKTPVSARSVTLHDNLGHSEPMKEVNKGIYQTDPAGMRGVLGGVYWLRIEMDGGRVYESEADTIRAPGSMDSLYVGFKTFYDEAANKKYSMDTFFDASYDAKGNRNFFWKFTATFQAETQPELNHGQCFWDDDIGKCNFVPPCSGYVNIGTTREPVFEKKYSCTCCTCWYRIYNDYILLSDDFVTTIGRLRGVYAQSVPLTQWTLLHKTNITIRQFSLSDRAFRFWRALKAQKDAVNSIFQPITGKIPINFVQVSGEPLPMDGLFFAASVSKISKDIRRNDLPVEFVYQISFEKPIYPDDCRNMLPNSTNLRPADWVD